MPKRTADAKEQEQVSLLMPMIIFLLSIIFTCAATYESYYSLVSYNMKSETLPDGSIRYFGSGSCVFAVGPENQEVSETASHIVPKPVINK